MKKYLFQGLEITFYFLLMTILFLGKSNGQDCQVAFTLPEDGSTITNNPITVEGTASIPAGTQLWALLGKRGFSGWWPQGNGPAFIFDGEWAIDVSAGARNEEGELERGTFYVILIVVNKSTHDQLVDWVGKAPYTKPKYKPIQLPTSVTECAMKRLELIRR